LEARTESEGEEVSELFSLTAANLATPWGKTREADFIGTGIWRVVGVKGAGYIVAEGSAKRVLSEAARRRGRRYGRYLCYAEPVDHLIVERELRNPWADEDGDTHRALSRHHPGYLDEVGAVPELKSRRLWEIENAFELRRDARDPDLIVDGNGVRPGIVRVVTADGATHFVTEESFDLLPDDALPRLSGCVVADNHGARETGWT
jgi:hypothetical protein